MHAERDTACTCGQFAQQFLINGEFFLFAMLPRQRVGDRERNVSPLRHIAKCGEERLACGNQIGIVAVAHVGVNHTGT